MSIIHKIFNLFKKKNTNQEVIITSEKVQEPCVNILEISGYSKSSKMIGKGDLTITKKDPLPEKVTIEEPVVKLKRQYRPRQNKTFDNQNNFKNFKKVNNNSWKTQKRGD
jgi:hypothetical protein